MEAYNRIAIKRENLFYYTDRSKLKGKVRAGIVTYRSNILAEEKLRHLGLNLEVCNAEL